MSQPRRETISLSLVTLMDYSSNNHGNFTGGEAPSFVWLATEIGDHVRSPISDVLSLAVGDITVTTSVFPFSAIAIGLRKWPFNFHFCRFNGFVSRYFCIIKPHLYPVLFKKKNTVLDPCRVSSDI